MCAASFKKVDADKLYQCEHCLRVYTTLPDECICKLYPYHRDRYGPKKRMCHKCRKDVLGYRSIIPVLQLVLGSDTYQPFWMELCGECFTTLEKVTEDWFSTG